MISCEKIGKIIFGGDYNPEQWSEDIWIEDMRMLKLAGIDTVTLNVFNWALLQRDESNYDFEILDKVMKFVKEHNMYVCLATATAAHPAWMAKKYPDILRTEFNGIQRKFGGRHNSCPNSKTYQKFSVALAEKIALRYQSYENIIGWHISNEFGGECYCENCEAAFQKWLQVKYEKIENLNIAWNTRFWGHTFYHWDEIVVPDLRSEHFEAERTMFQGISLDYRRFMSDSMLERYKDEYKAIKKITPHIKITTNLMGFYKGLDYQKWAKYMDFVSWDNYPSPEDTYEIIAMGHNLMRGIKQGMPFVLMEQTPSVTNWQPYNSLKRPGVMRLWSYQAIAHGADSVMFFQMRRSIGACEKYHGAVIDHVGNEHTRVFREITQLGLELDSIGNQIIGSRTESKIALVFDWDNWWALEYSAGPSCDLRYKAEFERYYTILRKANYNIDIISVEDSLDNYSIVIAPVLYMVKGTYDEKIRTYVKNGGTFITTFFSGIVQENDLVTVGGYPGKLKDILGIWAEENDALPKDKWNSFTYKEEKYRAQLLCDIIHLTTAEALAVYEEDFYAGYPVITKNKIGKGETYYIATASEEAFYEAFLNEICEKNGVLPIMQVPEAIEITSRRSKEFEYIFILNHSNEEKKIHIPQDCIDIISNKKYFNEYVTLKEKDVMILKHGK